MKSKTHRVSVLQGAGAGALWSSSSAELRLNPEVEAWATGDAAETTHDEIMKTDTNPLKYSAKELRDSNNVLREISQEARLGFESQRRLNKELRYELSRRDQKVERLENKVQALEKQIYEQSAKYNESLTNGDHSLAAVKPTPALVRGRPNENEFRLSQALDQANAQIKELQRALLASRLYSEQLEERLSDVCIENSLRRSSSSKFTVLSPPDSVLYSGFSSQK